MKQLRKTAIIWTRSGVPLALLVAIVLSRRFRHLAIALLVLYWVAMYVRYRKAGRAQTAKEWDYLRRTSWDAFWRHYNEKVPTIEEEYEIWGPYHEHRHEMRYDLVAQEARKHLPEGGVMFDLGCGSAMVADRLQDRTFTYIGMDFGGPHILYAKKKYADHQGSMRTAFVRGDGERLPLADESADVVVMSEVIEHLLRPDVAVWEIARILKPGGVYVMTTNNASEVPCRSPLSHPLAWIEKGIGADVPSLISSRPWVWPEKVYRELLPDDSPDVWLPHTHHIYAETKAMFAAAGLQPVSWKTFEFPPPQSKTASWLEKQGDRGLRIVDGLEALAIRTPFIKRLGCHIFMVSKKTGGPVAPQPPAGVWPGPLSGDYAEEAETSLTR